MLTWSRKRTAGNRRSYFLGIAQDGDKAGDDKGTAEELAKVELEEAPDLTSWPKVVLRNYVVLVRAFALQSA